MTQVYKIQQDDEQQTEAAGSEMRIFSKIITTPLTKAVLFSCSSVNKLQFCVLLQK